MKYPDFFNTCFVRLIKIEAGFTSDPKDPGNWTSGRCGVGLLKGTKYGIAANTYGHLDIQNLTLDEAKAIYYQDWWLKIGADDYAPAIVFQLWDAAVNTGMGTAKRLLQRAAKVADDGQIGPLTIRAIRAMDPNDLLLRFNAARIRYHASLSTWSTYGKGWALRVATNMDLAAEDN